MAEKRFLRLGTVLDRVGLRRSTIYDMMKTGDFPRPIKLAGGGPTSPVAWLESEIDAWQASRIATRDKVDAA